MKLSIRALVFAAAVLWGATVLVVGLANVLWPPYGQAFLTMLDSIYPGYHATGSAGSVAVGTMYAAVDGAIGGLLFGWLYNFCAGCCRSAGQNQP